MENHNHIQLHFDVMSCRALLTFDGRDYVLPDTYPSKEAAQAAAQKFAWDKLGVKNRRGRNASDLEIWLR